MYRLSRSTYSKISFFALSVLTVATLGCRQDMHDQPKFLPLRGSSLFADGRSARNQVPGTVARSQGEVNSYFLTGLVDGKEGDGLPIPVTPTLLARGQERYNVYCSPCHSRVGNGEGMIVQRGYYQAANFHSDRLRRAPLGHFVNVIVNGYGAMPTYAAAVKPMDRWAIAAYIRALQLSQDAKTTDAPRGAFILPLKQVAAEEGLPDALAQERWGIQTAKAPPIFQAPVREIEVASPAKTNEKTAALDPPPGGHESTTSAKSDKPAVARAARPAKAAPTGDPVEGKKIYTANCLMCHQANRAGNPPMIPSLVNIVSRVGKGHVHDVVTNGIPGGRPAMPAFGDRLSSTDIDNLIAYLQSK
jgi:mono/diheme cytochrome c family protein